jgi:hypothetical protein
LIIEETRRRTNFSIFDESDTSKELDRSSVIGFLDESYSFEEEFGSLEENLCLLQVPR